MKICDDCKFNSNNKWCKYFSVTLISMGEVKPPCLGYKKKTNKTNTTKKKSIKQWKFYVWLCHLVTPRYSKKIQ